MSSTDPEFLIKQAQNALKAYRETKDFDHLVDLYYFTIMLLSFASNHDKNLISLIEEDLKLFIIHSN